MTGSNRKVVLAPERLTSAVFVTSGKVEGYVFDREEPARQLAVELYLDGWVQQVRRADLYDRRTPGAGSHLNHGFCFSLPAGCEAREAEVRLANTPIVIGEPVDLASRLEAAPPQASVGVVRWRGGLEIDGHLADVSQHGRSVRGIADGRTIFEEPVRRWTHVTSGQDAKPVPHFAIRLPAALADGRFHKVEVVSDDGLPLAGSPLDVIAFPDGLESIVFAENGRSNDALRARVFDRMAPRSIPLEWIDEWLERFPVSQPPPIGDEQVAVVVIGNDGVEATAASLADSLIPWVLAAIPCDPSTLAFDGADLLAFLEGEAKGCRTLVMAPSGTRFRPGMAAHFAHALREGQTIAFCDVVLEGAAGPRQPLAYAGFDPERLIEQGAGMLCCAFARQTALAAAVAPKTSLSDMFLRAVDEVDDRVPVHLPAFLATCPTPLVAASARALADAVGQRLERHGAKADIRLRQGIALPAVQIVRVTAAERITVLVTARNDVDELRLSIDVLRATRSRHGLDLHVVDMGTTEQRTLGYLSTLKGHHQHVFLGGETHNLARAFNRALGSVRSRYVLFLEAGCRFEETDWVDDLVGRCSQADVAAAGPLLVTSGGIIEAAGLVCDPHLGAASPCAGASRDDPGDADLLRVARSCTALPLSGMMTERRDFLSVGGFDADRFGRHLLSVDYGLRLSHGGRRLVFSPHATLTVPSRRATTFDRGTPGPATPGLAREIDALRAKWGDALVFEPRHSPSLAHVPRPFAALAWPPRRDSLHAPPER